MRVDHSRTTAEADFTTFEAEAPTAPRAAGTCSITRLDPTDREIMVFAEDRAVRARICDHVRARELVPLPIATGLDAILTLERITPRMAIIATTFTTASEQLIDFLRDEHPATEVVAFGARTEHRFHQDVKWLGSLGELDAKLDQLTARGTVSGRALVIASYEPFRRALCDAIGELGWKSTGVSRLDHAERALATGSFDVVIVDGAGWRIDPDAVSRLRRTAPGLPAILVRSSTAAPPRTIAIHNPDVGALGVALRRLCGR